MIVAMSQKVGAQKMRATQNSDGSIVHTRHDGQEVGQLLLLSYKDREYRRLTLSGMPAYKTLAKRLFWAFGSAQSPAKAILKLGMDYNADPLCHFDFTDEELRSGVKQIQYVIQVTEEDSITFNISCYDFQAGICRAYQFADPNEIAAFAEQLNIKEVHFLNADGLLVNKADISCVSEPLSLGTMLYIMNAVKEGEKKGS